MESARSIEPIVTALTLFGLGPEEDSREKRIRELRERVRSDRREILALRLESMRCAFSDQRRGVRCTQIKAILSDHGHSNIFHEYVESKTRIEFTFVHQVGDNEPITLHICLYWTCERSGAAFLRDYTTYIDTEAREDFSDYEFNCSGAWFSRNSRPRTLRLLKQLLLNGRHVFSESASACLDIIYERKHLFDGPCDIFE